MIVSSCRISRSVKYRLRKSAACRLSTDFAFLSDCRALHEFENLSHLERFPHQFGKKPSYPMYSHPHNGRVLTRAFQCLPEILHQ